MDKGIYTALSGGIAKSHELELLSNNLANVNTPGFKRDAGTFNEYLTELRRPDSVEGLKRQITAETMLEGRPSGDKSFVEMDSVYTNFSQGPLEKTNRTLDVGLEGNGFFEVLTPAGVRYTRGGNFSIGADGRLVTVNGFPVLGSAMESPKENRSVVLTTTGRTISSGPDTEDVAPVAPPEQRIIQLGQAPVQINENGEIYQGGRRVGMLSIQEFKESQWLEKVGSSYYRNARQENLADGPVQTKAHQGFLEGSNVNPVAEMTKLIDVTRAYESHMQAIKTYQEMDGRTVNDIARER